MEKIIAVFLLVVSLIVFVFGMVLASGAPQQAAVAGISCYLGILARLAQASHHHKLMANFKHSDQKPKPES